MERYFWIGYNQAGKTISTMTLKDEVPKEMKIVCGFQDGEFKYETYSNFVQITREEALKRQKEGLRKLLELQEDNI